MIIGKFFKLNIMIRLTSKNADYKVMFDCTKQSYTVYYKNSILVKNKYKYTDIQSYLS